MQQSKRSEKEMIVELNVLMTRSRTQTTYQRMVMMIKKIKGKNSMTYDVNDVEKCVSTYIPRGREGSSKNQ